MSERARQHAFALLEQGRHDLALDEFRKALAGEPDAPQLHYGCGVCLLELERYAEAREHAQQVVGLAPDIALGHLLLARIELCCDRPKQALVHAAEAKALDPEDTGPWAVEAFALLQRKRAAEALTAAENGLRLDGEDEPCLLARSQALHALGRGDEADAEARRLLELDPESDAAHANQGWTELRAGRPDAAKRAFAEALRLSPGNEWARSGMIEAIKASNPLYRVLLRGLIWLGEQPPGRAWLLLIASVFVRRAAVSLGEGRPLLEAGANILVWGIFACFIALSILQPLGNLPLLVHPFGRHALQPPERRQALVLGLGLLAVIVACCAPLWGWDIAPDGPIILILAVLPLTYAAAPRLVPWSRALLIGLTLAAYLGSAVHLHDLDHVADARSRLHELLPPAAWEHTADGDRQLPEMSPEQQAQAERLLHAVAPALERSKWLNPLLLWGLIGFTWFGGFLLRTRPGR